MALSRIRAVLAPVVFVFRFLWAALRGRPLAIRHILRGPSAYVTPGGRYMPAIAGGSGEGEPEKKDDPEKKEPEDKKDDEDDDDEDTRVDPDDDWKAKSRKNETRAKKAERKAEAAEKKLREREEADQSDQEKAVSDAEKKGRTEAEKAAAKERQSDRLEVAVTRLASKKIKVGEGDDAKEVRFADTEDALLHIERAISRGDIDEDDIFDNEGRIKSDALQSELAQLLQRKPHLKEGGAEGTSASKGDPDTRKGDPAKNDLEGMSPEDHAKRKYGNGK